MIVLIDNYDSFSYNLYQLIGSVEPDVKVVRNDAYMVEEIEAMKPEAIILSPGPGKPSDAGICIEAIQVFCRKGSGLWCVSGTSGNLRSIWWNGVLCERTDARKNRKRFIRSVKSAVSGVAGEHFRQRGITQLAALKEELPEESESDCGVGRRRSDGGRTHKISDLRCTVSPGIGDDTGWQDYDRELYGCSQRRKRTMIKEAIIKVAKKEDLTYEESKAVMNEIMDGETSQVQTAAYLTALAMKGETIDEITGSAEGMRSHALQLKHDMDVLEIVGTGGDGSNSLIFPQPLLWSSQQVVFR